MELLHKELSQSIIGGFYEVYKTLGYGFLERVYANACSVEFQLRGHKVVRERRVPVLYKGVLVGRYQTDLIVDAKILVEVKAGRSVVEADRDQVLNYLACTGLEVGLLLHFGPRPKFHRTIRSLSAQSA